MNRQNIIYIILGIVVLFLIVSNFSGSRGLDTRPSYSNDDKIPFGTYVFYNMLHNAFPGKQVTSYDKDLSKLLDEISTDTTGKNLIIVNRSFEPDNTETKRLLSFVNNGNNLFVAASDISSDFLSELHINTKVINYGNHDTAYLNFKDSALYSTTGAYNIRLVTSRYAFEGAENNSTLLGINENQAPNLIRIPHGEGYIILNTIPESYANINMVSEKNWEYAMKSMSCLPLANAVWEDRTITHEQEPIRGESSTLSFIMKHPPLKYAWYLLLLSVLLFVLFEGKRKQKVIPLLDPMHNASVEFAKTIGRLYLDKRDNKSLAMKKITFFMEYLRTRFYIRSGQVDEALIEQVISKSALPEMEIRQLFMSIQTGRAAASLADEELLRLNEKIDEFYKKTS